MARRGQESAGWALDGDVASAAPTGAQTSSQWREIACGVAAGAVGTLVGFAAVAVARHGVGERPLLEAAILVAAVVVAVLPFRYALGVAVFVSMFQGFMLDFVGEQSLYWNELFTVGILVRSLYFKRPDRRELLIVVAGLPSTLAISSPVARSRPGSGAPRSPSAQ